jgi:hypothetical protein
LLAIGRSYREQTLWREGAEAQRLEPDPLRSKLPGSYLVGPRRSWNPVRPGAL